MGQHYIPCLSRGTRVSSDNTPGRQLVFLVVGGREEKETGKPHYDGMVARELLRVTPARDETLVFFKKRQAAGVSASAERLLWPPRPLHVADENKRYQTNKQKNVRSTVRKAVFVIDCKSTNSLYIEAGDPSPGICFDGP